MAVKYIIYSIKLNDKVYIGYTSDLTKRIKAHVANAMVNELSNYLYRAIRKYGIKNMKYEILEDNIYNKKVAQEREIYYISKYKSNDSEYGYNMTNGGDGGITWIKNYEDYKEKRSKLSKGENNSNYSGVTDDDIVGHALKYFLQKGNFYSKNWLNNYCKNNKLPQVYSKFRFNGRGINGLREEFLKKCKLEGIEVRLDQMYDPRRSSKLLRKQIEQIYYDNY